MRRRTFLMSAAGAATLGGLSLLGTWQANATETRPLRTAPTTPFAVGVRQYNWMRGSRQVTTMVYYPATGSAGGRPITNAPVAPGVFPVCEYTHGSGASPNGALDHIRPLAAAGFIVPAPVFTSASIGDTYNGNLPRDVSEVITRTLALNTGSDPLAGHIDTAAGVGVSGYSMGGMTTHALLTAFPDSRITVAVPMACVDMGNPSSTVKAKVLFMHGDRDPVCQYSSARQAYAELPPAKAFLTFIGADHTATWGNTNAVAVRTWLDWMRWTMYGDLAARDRLPSDAAGSNTRWEANLGPTQPPTTPPPAGQRYEAETPPAVCQGTIDSNHAGFSGSGFCNGTNAVGAYSQLTVNAAAAGTATLGVRFANGGGARPANLVVNGSTVATVSFESTGAWTGWSTKTLTAVMNAGSNTVRLVPTTAAGLPNIDFIQVG
ncbi:carbohydrate-binding protein [Micromonospora sp. CPCC 206061]|uniref:carbohydrate-binding protein n=1 Tax=Micromonospora sp. CPCC 206061 TaxID=3122410 RepID=UPI002FEF73C4